MKKKKTIFHDNKSLADDVCEGVIFALGTSVALIIISCLLTAISNL